MPAGGGGGVQTAGRPQVRLGGQRQTELPGTPGRSPIQGPQGGQCRSRSLHLKFVIGENLLFIHV